MALVGSTTHRRDIPHEEGEYIVFRQLSWKQLDEAKEARSAAVTKAMRAMGGEIYAAIAKVDRGDLAEADTDLTNTYDMGTLLRLGIAAWSYDAPVTPDTIDQLDDQTARWAMGCILGIHFMESAADRKNGSSGSALPSMGSRA